MLCPNCQTPLREGALFCTRCGTRTVGGRDALADSVPTDERGAAAAGTVVGDDPLAGRVLDGKYEILGRLGEGGMGAVYRARRVHIGDEVAVKVLHPKLTGDETLVERFRREARAAAQLHHPNVVTIHDYGEAHGAEGFAYIVMELVGGDSLRELLRREGKLGVARATSLMRDVCAGVGAAHRRGIVHRDIKPDNIIVLPADDDHDRERVKVVDFGIAKLRDMASDSTLTQAGSMVGTPFYMSPEQCRGESLDARADVYSLGALLYEMLAGTPPFTAPSITGVISKHLTEAPPPMPERLNVPFALQAAIARALAKDPNARQTDASDFSREIAAATVGGAAPPGVSSKQTRLSTPAPVFPTPTQPAPLAPQPTPAAAQQTHTQPPASHTFAQPPPHAQPAPPRKGGFPRPLLYLGGILVGLFVFTVIVFVALAYIGSQSNRNRPQANGGVKPPAQNRVINLNANASGGAKPSVSNAMERAEQKILANALLTREDLAALTPAELRVLRNAVYARYGRAFQAPEVKAYFEGRPWYRPRADFDERMLTANDRANAELIKAFESGGGAPAKVDAAAVQREVRAALEGWVSSTRARDLNAHARFYADTLDTYYLKQNVGSQQVLADRARAFTRYDSMDVEIDNVEIKPDPTGTRATATFDKTWDFEADDKHSTGSVRQTLWLAKVGDRWLITGEKDLKVHYRNSEDY